MDQEENIESTLSFYETAIRELEASVSLCTLCEMEKSYLNSEDTENQDSVSSFDLSISGDTTSTKSNIIQELPHNNFYPDTTIDSHQCEKFDTNNISSLSPNFSDFLEKTTKEVCEKLSNSRWNETSWDTCNNEKPYLKKNTEYETVLPTDLLTDEAKKTNEISKNLIDLLKNNTNDINDNKEKPDVEEALKINEISNNDSIARKRSNISFQARTTFDISDLKEFSESFMNDNLKARKKKSKMFGEYFSVSSMTIPVEKRTNDSPKTFESIIDEEIISSWKNIVEEITLCQTSQRRQKRSNESGKIARSVKEEILCAEEKKVKKNVPRSFEQLSQDLNTEAVLPTDGDLMPLLEDQLEEIPRKKAKIIADEIISVSAIHIPLKQYKYISEQQENMKNSQTSGPIKLVNSKYRIQLKDAEKIDFFHNQDSLINEEKFCDRVTIFSIEIPIASELKKFSNFQILSKKCLHSPVEDDNEQEILKNNTEEIEAPESNKNIGWISGSFNYLDVQHSDDTKKNSVLDKLTQEKKEITSKEVEFCSVEIPIAAELKKLSDIEIPMNETINQSSEDNDEQNFLHNSTSTKNINGSEELGGRNEENLESHYPEKLISNDLKEAHEEANIVREKEDEQNIKVSRKHDSSTVRALRKKVYPIDIPQVKDIQKSWEAVKKEFIIPKNKLQRRYRPLTQRKSSISQDSKMIREKNAKRRKLLDRAINRLHKLNSYTTELRNIFRKDTSITKMKKNIDNAPKKILVSTGTQTIDCGLDPLNHRLVTPSENQSTKPDIKSYATFVYNPYHWLRDPKNKNNNENCNSVIPSGRAIASEVNREKNINLSPVSIPAATIIDQNDNRVIEPIPKVSNSLNIQNNSIEFQNETKIQDIHSYNPLRPKRLLRKIKKSAIR